jgi:hypothetical protein
LGGAGEGNMKLSLSASLASEEVKINSSVYSTELNFSESFDFSVIENIKISKVSNDLYIG